MGFLVGFTEGLAVGEAVQKKQWYESNENIQLKDKLNNGKYTNILSEEVSSQNKVYSDNDKLTFPFILYTIKLK